MADGYTHHRGVKAGSIGIASDGPVTLSSTVAVTGAVTLSSTLAVTGTSTLTGAVTLSSTLSVAEVATLTKGYLSTAQSVTPDDAEGAGNTILAGVTAVDVGTVTNDADDFIVLPALADVPVGHTITIACNAATDFELRTPASSAEEINSENCDGTKEYVCTDTEIVKVVKINNTIGWMAHAFSAIGAVVTAVVPD